MLNFARFKKKRLHILESVLKKFKKETFRENFDFNLIYPTTVDAVHHLFKPSCFMANNTRPEPSRFNYANFIVNHQQNDIPVKQEPHHASDTSLFPSLHVAAPTAYKIEEDDLDEESFAPDEIVTTF